MHSLWIGCLLWSCLAPGARKPLAQDTGSLGVCEFADLPEGYRVAGPNQMDGEFANRLALETSPYLLQHARNPVDWYPWGEEAFAEARRRDVPIFLSIGYAACHWCHVMEHESFENVEIAALMNERYVNIKVDREERPDVDGLYMDTIHMMNGNGGWPASLWLTPDRVPFYAGTYFPPESRYGRPGFKQLVVRMAEAWQEDREKVLETTARVQQALERAAEGDALDSWPQPRVVRLAVDQLLRTWDPEHGGWGSRNKFPMTARLEFLLAYGTVHDDAQVQALVRDGLEAMDRGGIHDHLGGGFHRYTVDTRWVVPHFEKMLYDNAQLLSVYGAAAVALDEPRFAEVAEDIVDYLVRDLRHPTGAFYSSQDADSSEGEGIYYVWTPAQVRSLLKGPAAERFLEAYRVTEAGNFEHGSTVLTRGDTVDAEGADLAASRQTLLDHRSTREAPPTDTKRVVAWNGMTMGALARAGRLLDKPQWVALAGECADAVLQAMDSEGVLPRTLESNAPRGILDDHAFVAQGLLDLYEADPNPRWLLAAHKIAGAMVQRFGDPEGGGFFISEPGATDLLVRRKDASDGAEPSGLGIAVQVLRRLRAYGAPGVEIATLDAAVRSVGDMLQRAPGSHTGVIGVVDASVRPSMEVVLVGESPAALAPFLERYNAVWRPHAVLARMTPDRASSLASFGSLEGKVAAENGPLAYVCFDGTCKLPTSDVEAFVAQMAAPPTREP